MTGYLDIIGLPGLVGAHAEGSIPPFTGEFDVYYDPERNPLYVVPLANAVFYGAQDNPIQVITTRNPLYIIPLSNPVYYDPDNES